MFTVEKMSKANEVGIMLAPTSPFSNNIVSKEEFKLEEKNTPKDTETTKKNESAKPLRSVDYPENVYFSPLDGLGRAGMAYARINYDLIQRSTKKPRQALSAVYPSGWKQISYNENGQTKYLYNRAHLIAHSLCGEEANPANLITGTADFNAGENRDNMNTYEKKVAEYCRLHPNHTIIYKVTPVYESNNLVASYVIMEATDTTFNKVLFNVTVYNTQKGWNIDYKTGNAEKR
jgi:DNA-entry nuclease